MNSTRTALIVDDDDSTRMLLSKFLLRQGYEVSTAEDGERAIAMLEERSYSLVMLDLLMPKVDGLGVIEFLRDRDPAQLDRVIIITAYPRQLSSDPGVCAVVSKPFTLRILSDILRDCPPLARGNFR